MCMRGLSGWALTDSRSMIARLKLIRASLVTRVTSLAAGQAVGHAHPWQLAGPLRDRRADRRRGPPRWLAAVGERDRAVLRRPGRADAPGVRVRPDDRR